MDISDYTSGVWKNGYKYKYFMPEKINHPFTWRDSILSVLLENTSAKLGELNSFSRLVPDTNMFIRMHEYKEAVISSRIEGTCTNIEEALNPEDSIEPERRNDWLEVNNYVHAMDNAIDELKTLPLSCRLLRNTHKKLLSRGRGEYKTPGEFRRSQNWIGGNTITDAVFIPPAAEELPDLLNDFEQFLNNPEVPALIRIAIAHYQFETIHPFLDGNGRIGRLLVTLFLVANGKLGMPLLYLSSFFERNRGLYYDNLTMTRERSDLKHWVVYFLTGVQVTADESVKTLQKILELKTRLEAKEITAMGKRSKSGYELLRLLFKYPVVSVKDVQAKMAVTAKTAGDLIGLFETHNILKEITNQQRNRKFVFTEYMNLFTECIPDKEGENEE
jgi:Fic family protein